MTTRILTCLCLLSISFPAFGDERNTNTVPGQASDPGQALDRLDHLLRAAEHLDSAGLSDRAAEVRQLAERERVARLESLLAEKQSALQDLELEIAELEHMLDVAQKRQSVQNSAIKVPAYATAGRSEDAPHKPRQILLSVRLLKLHLDKMREAGFELHSLTQPIDTGEQRLFSFSFVDDRNTFKPFFETLRKQDLLEVLAEPSLITHDGQLASVEIGSTQGSHPPVETDARASSLRLAMTPKVTEDGKIRVSANFSLGKDSRIAVNGDEPKLAPSSEFLFDADPGQTAVVVESVRQGRIQDGSRLVMLLTVRFAEPQANKVAQEPATGETIKK